MVCGVLKSTIRCCRTLQADSATLSSDGATVEVADAIEHERGCVTGCYSGVEITYSSAVRLTRQLEIQPDKSMG
jgi:hypothetical protein